MSVAVSVAVIAAALAPAGCSRREPPPPPAPLYSVSASDVVVIYDAMAEAKAAGRAGRSEGGRSAADWLNLVWRAVGPARLIDAGSHGDPPIDARVVIAPRAVAADDRAATALSSRLRPDALLILDAPASSAFSSSSASPARVLFLDGATPDERAVAALFEAAEPLPRFDCLLFGLSSVALPVVTGSGSEVEAATALATAGDAKAHVTACVGDTLVPIELLERIRAARGFVGAFTGVRSGRSEPAMSAEEWAFLERMRERLRRMGATEDELAVAARVRAPAPRDAARLASAGVRRLAVPATSEAITSGADGSSLAALPYQAADEAGRPVPLLIVPARFVGGAAAAPTPSGEATNPAPGGEATDDGASWTLHVDAFARYWDARCGSLLFSSWDGSRLRIEADAKLDRITLSVPMAAGALRLREILRDGASLSMIPEETRWGRVAQVPMARGRTVLWAVYE